VVKYLLIIMLCVTPLCVNANNLSMTLSKTTVQLGKPIQATITANDVDKDISDINLEPLRNVFGLVINESSSSKDSSGSNRQQLKLSLYPRRLGITTVPALELSSSTTRQVTITTTNARAPGAKIIFSTHQDDIVGWQRQQHVISIRIVTPDKFASLSIDDIELPGIISATVLPRREVDSKGNTILTTGWVFSPYQAGISELLLPAVNYHLHGKVQRKFYPPAIKLHTQALPNYIPPNMLIGKPAIKSAGENHEQLHFSDSFNWKVILTGIDTRISPTPSFESQLQDNGSISFGSVSYSHSNTDDLGPENNTLSMSIPVSFTHPGYHSLPGLRIQYFDPDVGRLQSVSYPASAILVFNSYVFSIIVVGLAIAVLLLTTYAIKQLNAWYKCRTALRKLCNALLAARSPSELISLLREYARVRGWQNNISLGRWCHYWETYHGTDIVPYLDTLSSLYYSNSGHTTEQQQTLAKSLHDIIVKHNNCLFLYRNKKGI